MRCRSCNVFNLHAMGTQISMNARAVVGVNEVNCLGMLRPAYTGRHPADLSHATQMNMDKCSANHQ